ncbi:hypothetical protein SLEP1_g33943 [Rubroshorea leprosula]|uniref:Uncharacterized protein n=1 Tax=Rubroshorea leprosula TaxID=152421 RepID=A0AAV5KIH9_9ROSI|nr:hypothetical protein SLEP1_g33943 [Rubroshorea leprosula]
MNDERHTPHATNLPNPSALVITGDEGGGYDDDEMLSKGMVKMEVKEWR